MSGLQPGAKVRWPANEAAERRAEFDAALAAHHDKLLEYMRRRVADPESAADLAQETLTRMMKYRDALDIEDRALMLFRIANNLILEHSRGEGRHHAAFHIPLDAAGPLARDEPSVEAIADARIAIDLLIKHIITQLPPKCRLAFVLNRFDGQTYPQIADRMGISVKMVEKHITRALLACRAAVGDRDY